MVVKQHIAIICDYKLLENRIGGMDYFFWAFNKSCLEAGIAIDWFFPNAATHGMYDTFTIIANANTSIEASFINYIKHTPVNYTHVITHFVELCTSLSSYIVKASAT